MPVVFIYLLLSAAFILTVWRISRTPAKSDVGISIVWRGAVGGVVGGFFATLLLLGNDPYLLFPLTFLSPIAAGLGVVFAVIVWMACKRRHAGSGPFARAGVGAVAGVVLAAVFGLLYPHVLSDSMYGGLNHSAGGWLKALRVCVTFGAIIGSVAGAVLPPRQEETSAGDFAA